MAITIGGVAVTDTDGNVLWSRIINRPGRGINVTNDITGDGTYPDNPVSTWINFSGDTVTIFKTTNCFSACPCSTDTA